jgi:hypothetical protein
MVRFRAAADLAASRATIDPGDGCGRRRHPRKASPARAGWINAPGSADPLGRNVAKPLIDPNEALVKSVPRSVNGEYR